jgi:hypothetical protein
MVRGCGLIKACTEAAGGNVNLPTVLLGGPVMLGVGREKSSFSIC